MPEYNVHPKYRESEPTPPSQAPTPTSDAAFERFSAAMLDRKVSRSELQRFLGDLVEPVKTLARLGEETKLHQIFNDICNQVFNEAHMRGIAIPSFNETRKLVRKTIINERKKNVDLSNRINSTSPEIQEALNLGEKAGVLLNFLEKHTQGFRTVSVPSQLFKLVSVAYAAGQYFTTDFVGRSMRTALPLTPSESYQRNERNKLEEIFFRLPEIPGFEFLKGKLESSSRKVARSKKAREVFIDAAKELGQNAQELVGTVYGGDLGRTIVPVPPKSVMPLLRNSKYIQSRTAPSDEDKFKTPSFANIMAANLLFSRTDVSLNLGETLPELFEITSPDSELTELREDILKEACNNIGYLYDFLEASRRGSEFSVPSRFKLSYPYVNPISVHAPQFDQDAAVNFIKLAKSKLELF